MSQEIVGPLTVTSALGVQGGSLELGATLGAAPETPYVDFHFGLGAAQDFNVRLINPANNHLDVVTEAGGPVLSVHADKVGIGTTSPAAKLVVNEPAGGAELRVDGNNGLIGLSLGADAAQPWVGTRTNHDLRLLANNAERMRIQANGNVGIGTTSPGKALDVTGQGRFRSAPWTGVVPGVAGTVIGFDAGNAGGTGFLWSHTTAGVSTRLWLDGNPLIFAPGGTERLRIDGSGNVGIGTPSPNTKLDVAGGLQILTGSNPIRFTSNWIGFPSAVANGAEISNDTSLYKTLMVVGNYSAGMGRRVSVWDRLEVNGTFTTTGNVGIGTTNPLRALQIGSSIDTVFTFEPMDASPNAGYIRFGDNTGWKLHFGRSRENSIVTGATLNTGTTGVLMTLQDNGNVGIGTMNPAARLHVLGNVLASNIHGPSDLRLKTRVTLFTNVLEKLEKIHGVSFEWNALSESLGCTPGSRGIGVMAQEVEAVFPELVTTWGEDGYKAIDYGRLAAVLVEAIKELQAENGVLTRRIAAVEGRSR